MTEQVFLKAEYVTTEVKEECDEENYELFTETLNAKGEKRKFEYLDTEIPAFGEEKYEPSDDIPGEYTAVTEYLDMNLKVKIEEGISYACDQCEYAATRRDSLKRHKQAQHEGIRYPCTQCEYAATTAGHLKTHVKAKHKELNILVTNVIFLLVKKGA